MHIFLLFLLIPNFISSSADFENARISGTPRLSCSKRSITVYFDTNIPFQGRITVMKKMYIPECSQDYSTNILRNASFKLDIGRCTETSYMTNGSRVLTAHLEIGFHPLVITGSDRVYSVQCIDNSYAIVRRRQPPHSENCLHVVRTAFKWEGVSNVFHVGDAVVHEWSCLLDPQDMGTVQVYLASCNAISQAGQVIHLVDENGCVVDSELMGDLVYNSYIPKIYARAKVFKLMNGERYRIECSLQMCTKNGTCQHRPYPPKCAFTKDEIVNRYENKEKQTTETTLMTGGPNIRFDRQVKVSSEWITVHYNQYTNVDQLHDRYFITSVMDSTLHEEVTTTTSSAHFLMGISYREPGKRDPAEKGKNNEAAVTNPIRTAPASFKPMVNPIISSSEENQIETINEDLASLMPVVPSRRNPNTKPGQGSATPTPKTLLRNPAPSVSSKFSHIGPTVIPPRPLHLTTMKSLTTTNHHLRPVTTAYRFSGAMASAELKVKKNTTTSSPPETPFAPRKTAKQSLKGRIATMRFYQESSATVKPVQGTTGSFSTTDVPFQEDNEIFTKMVVPTATDQSIIMQRLGKETFANPRDWRLDDRTINDTDSFLSDKQVSCSNATASATANAAKQCVWSGLDHLLIIWSFGSALVWVVMLSVCFYRNSKKPPNWVSYREREMKKGHRSRVLPQEHPWLHADAFEEPKLRKKHEIDMSKF